MVQLVASTDLLRTWVDLYSLVDHFTIVPTFVGIYYNTNWIGEQCYYSSPTTGWPSYSEANFAGNI